MTDYDPTTDIATVKDAMDAIFENKAVNKKNDISGDFSSDNVSYPPVKGIKTFLLANYLTSTEINTLLSSYVTSTALNTILASYVETTDIVDNLTTNDATKVLSAKQGKVLKDTIDNFDTSDKTITIVKQNVADNGDASTYVIQQGGVDLSPKINIPFDKNVETFEVLTCTTADTPLTGLAVGDKYIHLGVITASGTVNKYINLHDFENNYGGDNVTIQLNANNTFSIVSGGVDTVHLADSAVTSNKISTAFKDTLMTRSDFSAFCQGLADAINPSND